MNVKWTLKQRIRAYVVLKTPGATANSTTIKVMESTMMHCTWKYIQIPVMIDGGRSHHT